jgi:hypothetical protein
MAINRAFILDFVLSSPKVPLLPSPQANHGNGEEPVRRILISRRVGQE